MIIGLILNDFSVFVATTISLIFAVVCACIFFTIFVFTVLCVIVPMMEEFFTWHFWKSIYKDIVSWDDYFNNQYSTNPFSTEDEHKQRKNNWENYRSSWDNHSWRQEEGWKDVKSNVIHETDEDRKKILPKGLQEIKRGYVRIGKKENYSDKMRDFINGESVDKIDPNVVETTSEYDEYVDPSYVITREEQQKIINRVIEDNMSEIAVACEMNMEVQNVVEILCEHGCKTCEVCEKWNYGQEIANIGNVNICTSCYDYGFKNEED